MGLSQSQRLRKRADFQKIYRGGIRVVGRFVVVFAFAGSETNNRLGITASRKIGSAVTRNRCKRRIRELFRCNRDRLPRVGTDIVINARRGCGEAPWEEVRRDYLGCLSRLRKELEKAPRVAQPKPRGD